MITHAGVAGGPVRDGDAAGRRTGRSMRGDRLVGAAARLGTGDRESRPPANGRHPGRGRLSCPTGSGRVQQGWTAVASSGRTAGPIRPATALVPASSDHWDGPSVVRRCTVTMADAGTPSGPGCEPLRRPPRLCRCRARPVPRQAGLERDDLELRVPSRTGCRRRRRSGPRCPGAARCPHRPHRPVRPSPSVPVTLHPYQGRRPRPSQPTLVRGTGSPTTASATEGRGVEVVVHESRDVAQRS